MTLRLTIALVALLLALPAAALAQGAGDEQYSDPFGPDQQQSDPTPQPTAAPTQAPSTAAPTSQAAPAPTAAPAAPQAAAGAQLPYTGTHEGWVALAGALLLGAGVALRVRLREER
jgi:LPXTG-motif cell wall-anchored protein